MKLKKKIRSSCGVYNIFENSTVLIDFIKFFPFNLPLLKEIGGGGDVGGGGREGGREKIKHCM